MTNVKRKRCLVNEISLRTRELLTCKVEHVRIQRGIEAPDAPPLKNHKNIGFLTNSDPDPLKNYEATESAFNVGPSWTRQRNAI